MRWEPRRARRSRAVLLVGTLLACTVATTISHVETAIAAGEDAKTSVVTFAGFRAHEDGSATLHVDMTRPAPVTYEHKGLSIVYLIEGAKIRFRNNRNPLRAEHFGANVLSAKLDPVKNGVTLTVTLRTSTAASHRLVENEQGALLEVDVPAPARSPGATP